MWECYWSKNTFLMIKQTNKNQGRLWGNTLHVGCLLRLKASNTDISRKERNPPAPQSRTAPRTTSHSSGLSTAKVPANIYPFFLWKGKCWLDQSSVWILQASAATSSSGLQPIRGNRRVDDERSLLSGADEVARSQLPSLTRLLSCALQSTLLQKLAH